MVNTAEKVEPINLIGFILEIKRWAFQRSTWSNASTNMYNLSV